jgi:catalase
MPVFFIQDAIKFPDLIHAVKPEPNNEIPQAASAHDTFWDFVSLTPESAHMLMWVMSDRALPRSFAMMEGFGVHTFRLVNHGRRGPLRQVPLETDQRRKIPCLGRSAEDLRQGPRFSPSRPLPGDRAG